MKVKDLINYSNQDLMYKSSEGNICIQYKRNEFPHIRFDKRFDKGYTIVTDETFHWLGVGAISYKLFGEDVNLLK